MLLKEYIVHGAIRFLCRITARLLLTPVSPKLLTRKSHFLDMLGKVIEAPKKNISCES